MYLSDRDILLAVKEGALIVEPLSNVDPTSIDLHLDHFSQARIWDIKKFAKQQGTAGCPEPELHLGKFNFGVFASDYLIIPPDYSSENTDDKVSLRGKQILIRPGGFLLWQTKEKVGTPKSSPRYICFVDGKSTRARTGIVVHLTAPTIHAGWRGNVVLEIANLGPFTFVLEENDVIAQLTVATISSSPERTHEQAGSVTEDQDNVRGNQKA